MKFINVDMTRKTIRTNEVPQRYLGLGGRGLTSIMINAEVVPTCDPLGPDNKLIIAPGALSGTSLVNTSRVSIGAKSPLTGTIKESNAGGTTGLAKNGFLKIVNELLTWAFRRVLFGDGNIIFHTARPVLQSTILIIFK